MSNQADSAPVVEETREVRFAVVMYGGVSLAIYINGVAQELLKMVRSTAKEKGGRAKLSGDALDGTERVYRKIAYLIGHDRLAADFENWLKSRAVLASQETGKMLEPVILDEDPLEQKIKNNEPLATRFIVDILSGTSAGGINGIFLAKALANDQKIDKLKSFWIEEGDIALLINDKQSVTRLPLYNQEPPQSLLNSRRTYLKILEALDGMGNEAVEDSPNVDELDLFITTTDIEGVPVPLLLADTVVFERRYRNMFHFKYDREEEIEGRPRNDFRSTNDPFLAFAARCTSSFPFAFEPMALQDIDEILATFSGHKSEESKSTSPRWRRFFSQTQLDDQSVPYGKRSFGDGGYLDNKPFSFATETLNDRQSDVPVDRKLVYIEPSPEHPEDDIELQRKPDAIENVKAAVLDLPGYETIREDLQVILQRNQLINRVNRIINGIERDQQNYLRKYGLRPGVGGVGEAGAKPDQTEPQSGAQWSELDLADMVNRKGPYYLPYRHLRIASLTDEIARLVARLASFDVDSDEFLAIRCLVRVWREENYGDYVGEKPHTVNEFLYQYDFKYRLRRLNFVRGKIDRLYRYDEALQDVFRKSIGRLTTMREESSEAGGSEEMPKANPVVDLLSHIEGLADLSESQLIILRTVLLRVKRGLNSAFRTLRKRVRALQSLDPKKNPLLANVRAIGIKPEQLVALLGTSVQDGQRSNSELDEDACCARAKEFLERNSEIKKHLNEVADRLKEQLDGAFEDVRRKCNPLLDPGEQLLIGGFPIINVRLIAEGNAARGYLWHYYENFDDYDQISFPIFYETDVGETDVIDVFRISPEDARSLVQERDDRGRPTGRRKLAGTALHNFGAFLDRVWRQNDIMWGRLDGAERLITALLPDDKKQKRMRDALITEAHEAILLEEMLTPDRTELCKLLTSALARTGSGESPDQAISNIVKPLKNQVVKSRLESIMRASLNKEEIAKFVRDGYEVNRDLEPQPVLRVISRSTQVIGQMLDGISKSRDLPNSQIAWIARLGKGFWGLIEVAAPNSLFNLIFLHWLKLLYFFEVLLVVGSTLLSRPQVQGFGLMAFAITVGVNFAALVLGDVMRGRHAWRNVFIAFFVVVIFLLAALGGLSAWGILYDEKIWNNLESARNWFKGPSSWRRWIPSLVVALFFLLAISNDIKGALRNYRRLLRRVADL